MGYILLCVVFVNVLHAFDGESRRIGLLSENNPKHMRRFAEYHKHLRHIESTPDNAKAAKASHISGTQHLGVCFGASFPPARFARSRPAWHVRHHHAETHEGDMHLFQPILFSDAIVVCGFPIASQYFPRAFCSTLLDVPALIPAFS